MKLRNVKTAKFNKHLQCVTSARHKAYYQYNDAQTAKLKEGIFR
jgi:hypothetical protein